MYPNSTIVAMVIAERQREAETVRRARGADPRALPVRAPALLRAAATWIAITAHR
jgi:hypothetical protein